MPSRLIDYDNGMGSCRDGEGYLFKVQVHANGIANGQSESCADTSRRTDRTENPGRAGSLILGDRGARTSFRPTPGDLVLLADPGFVLKPNFYGCICW